MMAKPVAAVLILGSLLIACDALGNINPLDRRIEFPLLPFDGSNLISIFDKEGIIGKACTDGRVKAHQGELLAGCQTKLKRLSIMGGNTASTSCKATQDFIKCLKEVINDAFKSCAVSFKDKTFVRAQVNVYDAMAKKLCVNNAQISEMAKKSGSCVSKQHSELMSCAKDNRKQNMKYDASGCKSAWSFVFCVEDSLYTCPSFAGVVKQVMSQGLDATACKEYEPKSKRSAASKTSSKLLQVILGIYAAVLLL